jgi:alkylation response protein AidB-like acyl-CoA dehydrogenase
MSGYRAPVADMMFALVEIAGHPAGDETLPQILEQAGKFAGGVLAPINRSGDVEGSVLENGVVRAPKGFKEAYAQFVAQGWNGLACEPEFGGQGLPWTVANCVSEMWTAANMSFALCPMLTLGAVELLAKHGSPEQKAKYLPRMVSGEWTGTMNLTEPQAGSDLGELKARAEPRGDHYRIKGQKVFITWGEHDMAANTIHMVLARTPAAPKGSKGISLFLVPKIMIGADGRLGGRNDLRCVSIEHKLGINASPTCVIAYGDNDGAVGWLIGEENRGLEAMFTMMNNERLAVGMQGVAIAERAYQQARDFARERVQGRGLDSGAAGVPIIRHPDVRRMLLTMKSGIDAARALTYYTASYLDRVNAGDRDGAQARLDLLTPVCKAWNTDLGTEIASLGIQVHGGMGYIEETGAAQHYRDARIAQIYEGTNGIQAMDLVFRKVARDGGKAMDGLIAEMAPALSPGERPALDALAGATKFIVRTAGADAPLAAAAAQPYLRLVGTVAGQYLLNRQASAAERRLKEAGIVDRKFLEMKRALACFYSCNVLPQAVGLAQAVAEGGREIAGLDEAAI